MIPPSWNPENLFGIVNNDPGYGHQTCVGHAKTQNRRCRNPINSCNRGNVKDMLVALARFEPSEAAQMLEVLYRLAELCLCVRYHRNQGSEVVSKWQQLLQREDIRRRPGIFTASFTVARLSPSARPRDTIRSSAALDHHPHSIHGRSESSTTIPAIAPRLQTSATPSRSGRVPQTRSDLATTSTVPSRRTTPPTFVPSVPLVVSRAPCSDRHVKRRSVDADCGICLDSMSNTSPSQLVWCKSQCGNSFHQLCWAIWQAHCVNGDTCVVWYGLYSGVQP
jgi:hypothetical protein